MGWHWLSLFGAAGWWWIRLGWAGLGLVKLELVMCWLKSYSKLYKKHFFKHKQMLVITCSTKYVWDKSFQNCDQQLDGSDCRSGYFCTCWKIWNMNNLPLITTHMFWTSLKYFTSSQYKLYFQLFQFKKSDTMKCIRLTDQHNSTDYVLQHCSIITMNHCLISTCCYCDCNFTSKWAKLCKTLSNNLFQIFRVILLNLWKICSHQ